MDYENITHEGTLEKIFYSEQIKPEDTGHEIIAPEGLITETRIEIKLANGGSYSSPILAEVPKSAVGKKVVLKESLKTQGAKTTMSQELQIEGLEPILTSLQYKN